MLMLISNRPKYTNSSYHYRVLLIYTHIYTHFCWCTDTTYTFQMDIFIVVMMLLAAFFQQSLSLILFLSLAPYMIPCPSGVFFSPSSKWDNKFMHRFAYTLSVCIKLKPNTLGIFFYCTKNTNVKSQTLIALESGLRTI